MKNSKDVSAIAISPNGNIAATGGGADEEIYLCDLHTGQITQTLRGKGDPIWNVGFAKDGRTIAWGKTPDEPLEQAFQLRGEDGAFNLALGSELQNDSGYLQAIKSVDSWSLRMKNDDTLQILKNGRVVRESTPP
jgi:WD40 repeat protein